MKKLLPLLLMLLPGLAWATWSAPSSTGAIVQAQGTNTVALNVPYPATGTGTIFLHVHATDVPTLTLGDAGFVRIATGKTGQGIDWDYCKPASGSESGNMTLQSSTANRVIAQMTRFPTGGSCTVDASANTGSSASLQLGYAALTVPNDNALILITGGKAVNVTSYSAPGGFTQIGQGSGSTQVSMTWGYQIQTSKANISSGTWTITGDASGNRSTNTIALAPTIVAATPSFTVSPVVSTTSSSSITFGATPSASATWYAVATLAYSATPTCVQIQAAHNAAGAAAEASANKAITGADTLALTGLTYPIYDVHHCLHNGSGDSPVFSAAAAQRSPRAANQIVCITSLSATSPFQAQTTVVPAANDCYELPTTLSGGIPITLGADADTDYISGTEREILGNSRLYHAASNGWAATTGADENFQVVYNNHASKSTLDNPSALYVVSTAVSGGDFCASFVDPDQGDTQTCTSSDTGVGSGADKRPTGTTITAGVLAGTPTTAGQAGTFTVNATDPYGAVGSLTVSWSTVAATATEPDCVGVDVGTCIATLQGLNLDAGTISFVYNAAAPGIVLTQSLTAGSTQDVGTSTDLSVSRGPGILGKFKRVHYGLGFGH